MTTTSKHRAIGGYFQLELPAAGEAPYPDAISFQSARSAFFAMLRTLEPACIWISRYTCDAILKPLRASKTAYRFYSLKGNFEVGEDLRPKANHWILCINYFGIKTEPYQSAVRRFGSDFVISDNAQAFFAPQEPCLAAIYSPHKLFGMPDGGLLYCTEDIPRPELESHIWIAAVMHLVTRLLLDADSDCADYLSAEELFDDLAPRGGSSLAEHILSEINLTEVAERRRENFRFLNSILPTRNRLVLNDLRAGEVPLCYPYLTDDPSLREHLRAKRGYTRPHWPEVLTNCTRDSLEFTLARSLVAMPCDQRYREDDLGRVAEPIARYSN